MISQISNANAETAVLDRVWKGRVGGVAAALAVAMLGQAAGQSFAVWRPGPPDPGIATFLFGLSLLSIGLLALLWRFAAVDWWQRLRAACLAMQGLGRGDLSAETERALPGLALLRHRLDELVQALANRDACAEAATRELAEQQSHHHGASELHSENLTHVEHGVGEMGSTLAAAETAAGQAETATASMVATAVSGCEAIATVLGAMSDIQDSSRKITEIIGVVDAIAFQTNILALNAAVESARAGEQGRGFAVVAGEVRQLATRSAVAAREIKGLVGKSAERIDVGSAQVVRARDSMENLLDCLASVSALIADVSGATRRGDSHVRDITARLSQLKGSNAGDGSGLRAPQPRPPRVPPRRPAPERSMP